MHDTITPETRSMAQIYAGECAEQPERLAQICQAYQEEDCFRAQLAQFRQALSSPGPIVWVGMGASYCSAISGSTLLQSCGRLSFVVEAGEWLHYACESWDQAVGPILVTTSGQSIEMVELSRRSAGRPLTLLCNEPESTCWSLAQIRLPILAGQEHGNATKSYSNATAACIIMASELAGRDWSADAEIALEAVSRTLDRVFDMRAEMDQFCAGAVNLEIVGRGPSLGGALMGALCLREMTGFRAQAHSGGSFRHGPLLDVDGTHVAVVTALGRTAPLGVRLAHDCVARGGHAVLVSAEDHPATDGLLPVKVDAVPEPWEGITSVLVPQAITLAMIERLGTSYVRVCTTVE